LFSRVGLGMSVLHKINPTVHRAVADAALPLQKIESRSKPWFPTLDKNNNNNNYDTLLSLTVLDAIQSEGGRVEKELIIDGEVMSYAIMRGALQVRTHMIEYIHTHLLCEFLSCTVYQTYI
jgi:hypothetical protein